MVLSYKRAAGHGKIRMYPIYDSDPYMLVHLSVNPSKDLYHYGDTVVC